MQVSDLMTRGVECTQPSDTIDTVARRMRELNVGSLPVCGESGKLVGVITDRDIATRSTAEGDSPTQVRVEEVMTPEIVYCFADQDVSAAAQLMEARQIRRLVVLDRDMQLAGIVSLGDLAVKSGDERLSGKALEAVSEPSHPAR